MYLHQLAALLALIAAPALGQTVTPVHLKINTEDTAARNKTAPNLYGLFFEDINVSLLPHRLQLHCSNAYKSTLVMVESTPS